MFSNWDCRHRLGLTVSGAAAPSLMKSYFFGSQTRLPPAPLIMPSGSGAIKPLCASSKEVLSENGSAFSNAALASLVAASAGFGCSADHALPASEKAIAVNAIRASRYLGALAR
ncbi:hypothetical protein D9M68_716480 [compost metagenome]